MKKLIIWDFDGVISDTEKLWVTSRMNLLNRDFKLGWNFDTTAKYIGGLSDKDKKIVLQKMGLDVKDSLWDEAMLLDMQKINQGLVLTPYIEDIFKMKSFDQCIATGGVMFKTREKIKQVGIEKYFSSDKIFTADLVEKGKPEPDLFLLAAKTMGYTVENCFIIEDSIAGLTAALRANITPLAFVKYHQQAYLDEIKKMNLPYIFDDMRDIKKFLESYSE